MSLKYPSTAFDEALAAVCHGTLTDEQAVDLNHLLRRDPAARDEYLLRTMLHARLASEPELFPAASAAADAHLFPENSSGAELGMGWSPARARARWFRRPAVVWAWVGAVFATAVALLIFGRRHAPEDRPGVVTSHAVAMLQQAVDARWHESMVAPRRGAPLEPGRLRLDSGLAQIVFHEGARVVIEGPAEIHLISPTEMVCPRGRLTAEVPPQARGFRVVAPRMDVTDLGTSFGLKVSEESTEVHVFEGTVEIQSGRETPARVLSAGEAAAAVRQDRPRLFRAEPAEFAEHFELQGRSAAAEALRYDRWKKSGLRLSEDRSLWVHFDFEHGSPADWRLSNRGSRTTEIPDGTVIGCQWTEGRWRVKPALEFRTLSDRVRLRVPGSLESVTLATWVRVQGLDRRINSLFMSDGFRPGTLHWVIRNDGVLGLTAIGDRASEHQILASPPVLTVDQFGLWTHLAVVVNGPARRVVHYLNGSPVSAHELRIEPPFHMGAAELGNWNRVGFLGDDPFLLRNFSGVMDEFCLFARALDDAEIRSLHAEGRPSADGVAAVGTGAAGGR